MENDPNASHTLRTGLCANCRFMRRIHSDRGAIFFLCERSATDQSFPKYPRLPVLQCRGYEQLETNANRRPDSSG